MTAAITASTSAAKRERRGGDPSEWRASMSTSSIGRLSHEAPPLDPGVFPVTRRWAYCDHAAVGPLPQPTRDAVVAALDAQTGDGCVGILDIESRLEAVRADV